MWGVPPQDDRSSRSTRTRRGAGHDALPQPRTGGRAGLPPGAGREVLRQRQPAWLLDRPPPAVALSAVSVLSQPSATIDGVPRWDDVPMVGRADELARLMAHVDRAVEGRPSAVLLSGDAGVGKTRLLDELSAGAVDRGVRVLTGHGVALGDVGLPYLPFVDLLRPVATDPGLAPTTAALPALTDLLGAAAPSPPPAQSAGPLPHRSLRPALDDGRLQLFESVALLLSELAAAAPL